MSMLAIVTGLVEGAQGANGSFQQGDWLAIGKLELHAEAGLHDRDPLTDRVGRLSYRAWGREARNNAVDEVQGNGLIVDVEEGSVYGAYGEDCTCPTHGVVPQLTG